MDLRSFVLFGHSLLCLPVLNEQALIGQRVHHCVFPHGPGARKSVRAIVNIDEKESKANRENIFIIDDRLSVRPIFSLFISVTVLCTLDVGVV